MSNRKKKRIKKAVLFNLKRFLKKTFWKLCGRLVEIAILFAIGYSLGLKLVRY